MCRPCRVQTCRSSQLQHYHNRPLLVLKLLNLCRMPYLTKYNPKRVRYCRQSACHIKVKEVKEINLSAMHRLQKQEHIEVISDKIKKTFVYFNNELIYFEKDPHSSKETFTIIDYCQAKYTTTNLQSPQDGHAFTSTSSSQLANERQKLSDVQSFFVIKQSRMGRFTTNWKLTQSYIYIVRRLNSPVIFTVHRCRGGLCQAGAK